MRRNKLSLFVHLVWATWDRAPLLTPEIERAVWRCVESEAVRMGCHVLAINGMPDHVHLAVRLPATLSVADLVKQVKGVSPHLVNDQYRAAGQFKWQGSYGAFSVSRWDLDMVVEYVRGQQAHHAAKQLRQEYEETFEEVEAVNQKGEAGD
jgi:REP element-mobilizing transposase RayT